MRKHILILLVLLLITGCVKREMSAEEVKIAKAEFFEAAHDGNIEKMNKLITDGKVDINAKHNVGDPVLTYLIITYGYDMEIIGWLIRHGVDVNAKGREDKTALHWASFRENLDIAKLLIEHGADVNARDTSGCTPLHEVNLEKLELAKLMVENGADLDARDEVGETPLHVACDAPHEKLVEFYIASGADVNARNNGGFTPLDYAVERACPEVVEALRKAGAQHSSPSNYELFKAAENGNLQSVKEIIARGVDMKARDSRGYTSLMLSAWRGHKEVVTFLVTCGANVNQKSIQTPLTLAVSQWHKDIAEYLIKEGADVNLPDYEGKTPLDLAKSDEMKQLLRAHGAVTGEELPKRKQAKE